MKRYGFLLMLALAMLVSLPACARLAAASPGDDGTLEIVMSEYHFSPDTIRLHAGQTVTFRLRNEGSKMHELMAGRDVQQHGNFTEGFAEDFFAGMDVEISGPGMVMGMEGEGMQMDMGEEGTDMGAGEMDMGTDNHGDEGDAQDGATDMEGMDSAAEGAMDGMEGMEAEQNNGEMDMEMGQDEGSGADTHDEGGDAHDEEEGIVAGDFGAVQLPLMDAHSGLMVMIDPQMVPAGEATTITFTVTEDKVGTWTMGCFQERGQHFDDGMNGTIIVEP